MLNTKKFKNQLAHLDSAFHAATNVLLVAPEIGDGDSIGAQLALRILVRQKYPSCRVWILSDQPLPDRYLFMPDVEQILTPEAFVSHAMPRVFDVAIVVDGGIDRAGRPRKLFERSPCQVLIDHHAVTLEYPYTIKIVEASATSTTELIYAISQSEPFHTRVTQNFAQDIYLGLVFDTGFFRHVNTTPQVLELAGQLLKTGFDFTRVGERGMLERSFSSLKLMSHAVSRAELRASGKIIYSIVTQELLDSYFAKSDDREGIIDHLLLTRGIEVAALFIELPNGDTKVSLRSQNWLDVAEFARALIANGGGHRRSAGATLKMDVHEAAALVLAKLELALCTL